MKPGGQCTRIRTAMEFSVLLLISINWKCWEKEMCFTAGNQSSFSLHFFKYLFMFWLAYWLIDWLTCSVPFCRAALVECGRKMFQTPEMAKFNVNRYRNTDSRRLALRFQVSVSPFLPSIWHCFLVFFVSHTWLFVCLFVCLVLIVWHDSVCRLMLSYIPTSSPSNHKHTPHSFPPLSKGTLSDVWVSPVPPTTVKLIYLSLIEQYEWAHACHCCYPSS